ncbi:PoNe immunity protein domain-containing protein [Shewanella woodyi]|uniref:PoNe immunity protein domain-containing protein n=1 Tax=Shewanella woodyi TaxID=60961 RepID=UPI003749A1B7
MSWDRFVRFFEHTLLTYSAGYHMEIVIENYENAMRQLESHLDLFPSDTIKYWEQDGYQYLLWLVSLAVLTGNPQALLIIARMTGKNPQGADDRGIVQFYTRVGLQGLPRQDSLVFEKPYKDFYDAIKGDGAFPTKAERQTSLSVYLKNWYQGMKGCYWHNRHKGRHATYFGYWSLESAATTILFDLDDSSFRKSIYYPKDWADYAREKGVASLFASESLPHHHLALPGDEAPTTAEWASNISNNKISVRAGERLGGEKVNENGDAAFWVSL